MLHPSRRRWWPSLLAAALLVLAVPGLVLAHAELETPTPADKSTVTEPVTEISGVYSQAMKPDGSSLVVKDASGTQVAKGGVDPADDTRMVATPATPLGNGTYRVESTTLATDGDVAHAIWNFTVAIAASAAPTASASAEATASAEASATPSPTTAPTPSAVAPTAAPSPSGDGTAAGSGSDVIIPIIVALLVLIAGAAYLLTRRNRPGGPDGTTPPAPPASPAPPAPPDAPTTTTTTTRPPDQT